MFETPLNVQLLMQEHMALKEINNHSDGSLPEDHRLVKDWYNPNELAKAHYLTVIFRKMQARLWL